MNATSKTLNSTLRVKWSIMMNLAIRRTCLFWIYFDYVFRKYYD